MTLTHARQGRLRALTLKNSDRRLIEPAQNLNDVVIPKKSSLDAGLLMMLHRGVSLKRLMNKSGWSASDAMVQVFRAVKRARLGLERRAGELFLVYPEAGLGSSAEAEKLRAAVQEHRAQNKPDVPPFARSQKLAEQVAV